MKKSYDHLYPNLKNCASLRLEYFGGLLHDKRAGETYALNNMESDALYLSTSPRYSIREIASLVANSYNLSLTQERELLQHLVGFFISLQKRGFVTFLHEVPKSSQNVVEDLRSLRGFVKTLNYFVAPIEVDFLITWSCNYKCSHCNVSCPREPRRDLLTIDEDKKILDELAEMGVCHLIITGGEPFLNKNFYEILEYATSKGLGVSVTTNGSLITPEVANELSKYETLTVIVSLDGMSHAHDSIRGVGSFDKAINAITILASAHINTVINTTLSKRNVNELADMLRLIKKLGVNSLTLGGLNPLGRAKKQMSDEILDVSLQWSITKELEEIGKQEGVRVLSGRPFWFTKYDYKKESMDSLDELSKLLSRCPASSGKSCAITPEGFVYPCDYCVDYPELIAGAGDLRQESFKEIWHNCKDLYRFRRLSKEIMRGKCKVCPYFQICYGKCRVRAYEYYGDFCAPDPRCPYEPHVNAR